MKNSTTRRKFLENVLKSGAAILAVKTLIPDTLLAVREKDGKILTTVKIADFEDLKEVGGSALIKDTEKGDILIVRISEKEFAVLSNVCPHKQCKVKVQRNQQIVCPCHKSAYELDGTFLHGPAKKSLSKFPFEVENGVISIKES